MKLADLHLHTSFSDGTFSPLQLVEEAKKAGLSCIAVTDHDSILAVEPVKKIAANSLEVIAGVELTTGTNTDEMHILGYFIDTSSSKLKSELEIIRKLRRERIYGILEKLKGLGVDLDPQEVFKIVGEGSASRLHIARAMLAKGIISNIYEAFNKYISNSGPAYIGNFSLTPAEGIKLILDIGGIPVLAHPCSMNCDELIPGFVKAGLKGLEVYYPEYSESIKRHYLGIAEKYNLLVTGGSDCHGQAKPNVKVGKVSVPYELVEKLKEEKYG